ncbi:MAG: efflux transporter periplasmic adaptor subunit [Sphingobium sp.]|nr:MAG: efflux transporter periplasmic adaptor subunit [Sphingobium sp.]
MQHWRTYLRFLVPAGAFASILLISGCGKAPQKERPTPEAGYVVVHPSRVPQVVELAGRTTAFQTSEVRPQVSGVIFQRLFTEGTMVTAGQTLYQIDPSLYQASVNQARANLENAGANAEATRARADRYRPLADAEAVARQDYVDAAAAARQAAASVEQSRAQLETARINLRFTKVPAPITGRIGRSLFTQGALVTANQADPLAVIQRLDPIFVDMQQSSADLLALRRSLGGNGIVPASADVRLKLEDGSDYPQVGRVAFSEVMVDPTTGTVTLRAQFPNPQGLLLPGMFVRATLAQSIDTRAFLVPQQAVTRDAKGTATVYLVSKDNKAVARQVTAIRTQGANWVVTAGLSDGDKVIVQGLGNLKPDGPVRPVPANTPQQIGGVAPAQAGEKN